MFSDESDWTALLLGLRLAGHDVERFGDVSERPDALVTINHQPEALELRKKYGIGPNRTVLVALEPPVTAPIMYLPRVFRGYRHRFAASPMWAQLLKSEVFRWPQEIAMRERNVDEPVYEASLINAEKRSAIAGSLYGLRRSVIQMCDSRQLALAVFGPGWSGSPQSRISHGGKAVARALRAGRYPRLQEAFGGSTMRPRNWLGAVPDKTTAFAVAPATIVIENSPDYVSEKLVDAISAGVAPLYVGPPLQQFGFPSSVAIECPPQADAIVDALLGLTSERAEELVAFGRHWLASAQAQEHEITRVLSDLGQSIGARLKQ